MFNSDIRVYGNHAKILKRYSKSRNRDELNLFFNKRF